MDAGSLAVLTSGAILGIYRSEVTSAAAARFCRCADGPLLQVIDIRPIKSGTGTSQQRYRLILSDGDAYQQAMLATQKNDLVTDGKLKQNAIVRLSEFICTGVQNRRIVIVLDLDIVEADHKDKIGAPQNIDTVVASGTAGGAGGVKAESNTTTTATSGSRTTAPQQQQQQRQAGNLRAKGPDMDSDMDSDGAETVGGGGKRQRTEDDAGNVGSEDNADSAAAASAALPRRQRSTYQSRRDEDIHLNLVERVAFTREELIRAGEDAAAHHEGRKEWRLGDTMHMRTRTHTLIAAVLPPLSHLSLSPFLATAYPMYTLPSGLHRRRGGEWRARRRCGAMANGCVCG